MQTRYELPLGRYSLRRERDSAGDSGSLLEALWIDNENKLQREQNVVETGKACRVGSHFTRMFGNDWWMTTPIIEFLEVDEEKLRFRFTTKNSIYVLEKD